MIKKLHRHLLAVNCLVFVLVLGFFSCAVYWSVIHSTNSAEQQRLEALGTTLSASIESPEDDIDNPPDLVPDVVQSHDGRVDRHDMISLQWFDANGKLMSSKGGSSLVAPFDRRNRFQTQQSPHALLLTQAIYRKGHLLGFLRVGLSLSNADNFNRDLERGLLFGTLLTLVTASVAVLWLVREALKPVQVSFERLSEFTADASHELKGPITAIKTNSSVILKYSSNLANDDREKMESIISAADQMNNTISDLLSLAANEHDIAPSLMAPVDVLQLVDEVKEELSPFALHKDVTIDSLVPDSLVIVASKDDVKRVLLNLVKNAIQYSRAGENVSISASRVGNKIQFQIKDVGLGIREDDLPKIFDRFWRSDKARSHTGGNGLGLSIVQSIVNRYKGHIAVQSKLDHGTIVTISLPDKQSTR